MLATHVSSRPREPMPNINEVECLSESDLELFTELREVLSRHGALKKFGIFLLHQHFEVAPDEVMMERTDVDNRRQLIEPVKIDTLKGKESIETSWRLDIDGPVMYCRCYVTRPHQHEHFDDGT